MSFKQTFVAANLFSVLYLTVLINIADYLTALPFSITIIFDLFIKLVSWLASI